MPDADDTPGATPLRFSRHTFFAYAAISLMPLLLLLPYAAAFAIITLRYAMISPCRAIRHTYDFHFFFRHAMILRLRHSHLIRLLSAARYAATPCCFFSLA